MKCRMLYIFQTSTGQTSQIAELNKLRWVDAARSIKPTSGALKMNRYGGSTQIKVVLEPSTALLAKLAGSHRESPRRNSQSSFHPAIAYTNRHRLVRVKNPSLVGRQHNTKCPHIPKVYPGVIQSNDSHPSADLSIPAERPGPVIHVGK